MFICTRRVKEPSETAFTYTILDTDDMVEEQLRIADIKEAFKQGYNILGLEQTERGIGVDLRYMSTTSEYRYYNNENLHIPVNYIKYHKDEGIICIECNCSTNDNYKIFYFIKDNKIIGNSGTVPRKDPRHGLSPVDIRIDKVTEYKGFPLVQISLEYYDKHFYHEDKGCFFMMHKLIFKSEVVKEINWYCIDKVYFNDWQIPNNIDGEFTWCNNKVNLDMWL